jgi:hypothetical protein
MPRCRQVVGSASHHRECPRWASGVVTGRSSSHCACQSITNLGSKRPDQGIAILLRRLCRIYCRDSSSVHVRVCNSIGAGLASTDNPTIMMIEPCSGTRATRIYSLLGTPATDVAAQVHMLAPGYRMCVVHHTSRQLSEAPEGCQPSRGSFCSLDQCSAASQISPIPRYHNTHRWSQKQRSPGDG